MSLNFGNSSGNTSLGLGTALPAFDASSYSYTPTPPSFDPASGTTRFQQMYAQTTGTSPSVGAVDNFSPPPTVGQTSFQTAYQTPENQTPPQLYDNYYLVKPTQGYHEIGGVGAFPGAFETDYGYSRKYLVPFESIGAQGDPGQYFVGGSNYGLGNNNYGSQYSFADLEKSGWLPGTNPVSWEPGYNEGGLVRRGDKEIVGGIGQAMRGYNVGGMAQGGLAMALPSEPFPQGADVGQAPPDGGGTEELINYALVAIDPNSEMPEQDREAILALFEEVFGPGSVEALREEYMGNDEVMAAVTPGETIIPKNKTLQAGGGNAEAGAQNIMKMVDEMNRLQGGAPADALGGAQGIAAALGGGPQRLNDGGMVGKPVELPPTSHLGLDAGLFRYQDQQDFYDRLLREEYQRLVDNGHDPSWEHARLLAEGRMARATQTGAYMTEPGGPIKNSREGWFTSLLFER